MRIIRSLSLLFVLLFPLLLYAHTIIQDDEPSKVKDTIKKTLKIQQQVQTSQEDWHQEEILLKGRYEAAQLAINELKQKRAKAEQQHAELNSRVNELKRRLAESQRLEESLEQQVDGHATKLEQFIKADLPFLAEERNIRLENLKSVLQGNTPPGEKLRRLLEALQIEAEYGNTVEVYQQRIEVSNESILADILRLGRISLFWQSPDGERIGEYDRVSQSWQELPRHYRRHINMAVQMAQKVRPVELVNLPIGRLMREKNQ